MSLFTKLLILTVIASVVVFIWSRPSFHDPSPIEETWWGPGEFNPNVDKSIKPFKIQFSDEMIDDLKRRLNNTRDPIPSLEGSAWTYGISGPYLKNHVLSYWLNKYDFKGRLKYLNQFPQFTTNIQGLNIHYLHVKPKDAKGKRVLPLIMLHGWGGSVREFYKVIPSFTTPKEDQDFVFEVIIPSLPGFAFSDAAVKPGLGSSHMALIMKNFMLRLGFDKFYAHGGDWGGIIAHQMSSLFPNHIMGVHSTLCTASSPKLIMKLAMCSYFPSLLIEEKFQHWWYPMSKRFGDVLYFSGYYHLQATKPDTIGIAFADSPAGLAAYMMEKYADATNPANSWKDNGGLFEKFTEDELIDNLMLYWVPNKMTSAMRIYAESTNRKTNVFKDQWLVHVPSACAQFPHEIAWYPAEFLRERYTNLIQLTDMPRGGHFSTFEEPELVSSDILAFVSKVERLRVTTNKSTKTDL